LPHYVKNDVIDKSGSTQLIALSTEEDRVTAKNFMKFRHVVFWDMLADTHKETDIQTR